MPYTYDCRQCEDAKPFRFELDFSPGESPTRYCPGDAASAEITNVEGDFCPQCGGELPDEGDLLDSINEDYEAAAIDAAEHEMDARRER